jgi:AcrR family transcriptional regulator
MTEAKSDAAPRRRQRRKAARPNEIVAAAMQVFAEEGFGGATMEAVARRAGVAKGTVFVYFPSKQDLFRAVARDVLSVNFAGFEAAATGLDRPLDDLIPLLLAQAARVGESPIAAIIRILVAEARSFPDLAQVWHDEVVAKMLGLLTKAIARAQARGEVRAGDPKLYAFSIFGPMMAGVIFREVFRDVDAELPALTDLAAQHARAITDGLRTAPP